MIEPLYLIVSVVLVCGVVVFWRFSGVMSGIAQSTSRAAERQAAHRERFLAQMVEKLQVDGDTKATVTVAHMHAQEATQANNAQLHRDAMSDHQRKVDQKRKDSVVRDMMKADDPDWNDKDQD